MIVGALLVVAGVAAFAFLSDPLWLILIGIGLFGLASPFLRSFDRALARANPQGRVGEECVMQFMDQGLRFEQGAMSGFIDWSATDELRVGEGAILIMKNRAVLAGIPKRAFGSPADLHAAEAFLAAKVPKAG